MMPARAVCYRDHFTSQPDDPPLQTLLLLIEILSVDIILVW